MTDVTDAVEGVLADRVAFVTGAGSGIGRASAELLAARGASVRCADVRLEGAEETVAAIRSSGGRAEAVQLDVTDAGAVEDAVARTATDLGCLDVMANIAGINHPDRTVLETTEEELDRILATNFKGVLFGCQAAARLMIEQGAGSIVNLSSTTVDTAVPGSLSYGVSKAAVTQLTRTLAGEVAPHGVRVNAIAPGAVITNMTARHFRNADGEISPELQAQYVRRMEALHPLGFVSDAADIAEVVLFLASDASRSFTGQMLRPNGGLTMPW